MANDKKPVIIKKYANRRLYDTGTSAYVTLEDLAHMVKSGQDFQVFDAKSGDDITRSVLTQIIFEQESKGTHALLPVTFLRQLIRFYGHSMQGLVPSYLEFTLDRFTGEQQKFRQQFTDVLGTGPIAGQTRHMFENIEEQTRKNMQLFQQALSMFSPFPALGAAGGAAGSATGGAASAEATPELEAKPGGEVQRADIEALKEQMATIQHKIDAIAKRD